MPCWFELSVRNVDKPSLEMDEIWERCQQSFGGHGMVLSTAARFEQKSQIFPSAIFAVGADTILRLCDPVYYDRSKLNRDQSIKSLEKQGCQFLVFGRLIDNKFACEQNISLPANLKKMCRFIDEPQFRIDLSSTKIRNE